MIQDPLPFEVRKGSNVINPNPVETTKLPAKVKERLLSREPMTYDELLDYLREHEEYWTSLRANRWAKVPAFNALRAVVELCKFAGNGSMIAPELIIQTIRAELR